MKRQGAIMDSPLGDRGATVEFRDVSKHYDSSVAVENFSLAIEAGEFLTLLGPSGSGKTTLLNMVAGFINPSGGEIRIGASAITALPTERRNIGMVFQNYSLFPHMTVEQNVAFPLKMRRVERNTARQRVEEALSLVGLDGLGRRMPAQLSGGQKQRVAFARAIVFKPKVLLMDEPLGALDLKLRERMQLEIVKYRKEVGCTVIYVTHDQGEALAMSDRIVVMDKGVAVQVATPVEIYDHPNSLFAANFVGETNVLRIRSGTGQPRIEGIGALLPATAVGSNDILCIRPEKFQWLDGAADASRTGLIAFDVTVLSSVFAGDELRISARALSGQELLLKEPRGAGTRRQAVEPGETMRIGFHLSDAVFLHSGA
jgi:putative spermidine/putrescine transport system ATP-binding protein